MISNRSFLIYSRQNFCWDFLIYIFFGSFQINLNFEYNLLHLLHNVREGGTIIAGYEYGYGGVKLKVWGSDGNGDAYVGKSGLPVVVLLFLKAVFSVREW